MTSPESPLTTDLYELNMVQAYLDRGEDKEAVFEFFVRRLPERRGFLLTAGLDDVHDPVAVDVADREDAPEAPGKARRRLERARAVTREAVAAAEEDVDDAVAGGRADDEVGIWVAVEVARGERRAEAAAAGDLGALCLLGAGEDGDRLRAWRADREVGAIRPTTLAVRALPGVPITPTRR